jgi:hypothetical protein
VKDVFVVLRGSEIHIRYDVISDIDSYRLRLELRFVSFFPHYP